MIFPCVKYITFTLHSHYIHTTFTLHSHFIRTTFTLHSHYIHTTLHYIQTTFTLHLHIDGACSRSFERHFSDYPQKHYTDFA